MDPDKLSAGSGSGWMGDAEESPKIMERRAVYERPGCQESVFGKMLAIETMSLCAPYLQYSVIKYYYCSYQMYQYVVKHVAHII